MNISTFGEPRFAFSHCHAISDELRIPERIEVGAEPGLRFELAGASGEAFFRSVLATTGQPEKLT